MKKLTNNLMRGLVALTVAGLGLAVTPAHAHAPIMISRLTKVPSDGANDVDFLAAELPASYQEDLTS